MAILEKDPDAQLLDIRPRGDFSGSPDLSSAKKSALACPYKPPSTPEGDKNSTVSLGWAERVGRMGKVRSAALCARSTPAFASRRCCQTRAR